MRSRMSPLMPRLPAIGAALGLVLTGIAEVVPASVRFVRGTCPSSGCQDILSSGQGQTYPTLPSFQVIAELLIRSSWATLNRGLQERRVHESTLSLFSSCGRSPLTV